MADSESSAEDRDIPASQKRLDQAAEEGNVPRSRDLSHLLVLSTVLATVWGMAPAWQRALVDVVQVATRFDARIIDVPGAAWRRIVEAGANALWPALVVLLAAGAASTAASVVPGGFNLTVQALMPNPGRLDPMAGAGRLLARDHLVTVLKAMVIAALLGRIGWWFVSTSLVDVARNRPASLLAALPLAGSTVAGGLALLLLVIAAVAVLDVPWQWWHHRSGLKMTREEAREESRQSDGDPMVKGRIRQRQREAAQRRMMAAVPSASVVLTNPTHYAVALRYEAGAAGAPVVVAKGVDAVAMRIQAVAREAGVPVLQAPVLARALHAHVRLDDEVPRELYAVIAQVLTWVYQVRQWVPGRGLAPREPAGLSVPPHLYVPADAPGGAAR